MSSTAILPSILRDAAAVDDLLLGRLVERAQNVGVEPVLADPSPAAASSPRTCRSGRCGRVMLSFFVVLSSIQLPRSGMTRQLIHAALAGFHFGDEVDAGAAVQLAHHDALGAVDDELAAAEHDRHVAEVDLFLDRLLFVAAAARCGTAGRRSAAAGGTRPACSAACRARSAGTRA